MEFERIYKVQPQSSNYKGATGNDKYGVDFNAGGKEEELYCRYCRKLGHLINRCPKLHRRDNNQTKSSNNSNFQHSHRGNRSAAVAFNSEFANASSCDTSQHMSGSSVRGSSMTGSISQEQMNQLMQLIQGVQFGNQVVPTPENVGTANLAGVAASKRPS